MMPNTSEAAISSCDKSNTTIASLIPKFECVQLDLTRKLVGGLMIAMYMPIFQIGAVV